MINKVTLIGNLGADAEVRTLESGATVARLRLATTENYKDKDGNWQKDTEWHTVVAWRDLAARLQTQAKKGMLIYVEGKLTHRTWTDQNNVQHNTTEILANTVRLLEKRDQNSTYNQQVTPPQDANTPPPVMPPAADGDDLPF